MTAEIIRRPKYTSGGSRLLTGVITALSVASSFTPRPLVASPQPFQSERPPTMPVVSRIAAGDIVGGFADLAVIGGHLVVIDSAPLSGAEHIRIFDRSSGNETGTTGRSGQGPGEFQMPFSIGTGRSEAEFLVYDVAMRRLTGYSTEPWSAEPIQVLQTTASPFYHPNWLGAALVANGSFEKELLRYYEAEDGDLVAIGEAGRLPFGDDIPASVAVPAAQTVMTVNRSVKRIAVAFTLISRVQVYQDSGELLFEISGPEDVDISVALTAASPRFRPSPDTRFAYVDISADERFIFALFSGRQLRDSMEAQAPVHTMTDRLHVFSWDGDFIGEWRLGEEVSQIAAAANGSALYGAGSDATQGISAFGPFGR